MEVRDTVVELLDKDTPLHEYYVNRRKKQGESIQELRKRMLGERLSLFMNMYDDVIYSIKEIDDSWPSEKYRDEQFQKYIDIVEDEYEKYLQERINDQNIDTTNEQRFYDKIDHFSAITFRRTFYPLLKQQFEIDNPIDSFTHWRDLDTTVQIERDGVAENLEQIEDGTALSSKIYRRALVAQKIAGNSIEIENIL